MWSPLDLVFKVFSGKRSTSTDKKYYEEFTEASLDIYSEDVKDFIPSFDDPAQSITDGIAEQRLLLVLTKDISVADDQCYYAYDSPNRLTNWISDRFGDLYRIRLYDNSNNEIFPTDDLDWIFNYKTGVLTMNGDTSGFSKPFKISGYRYIGSTGGGGGGVLFYPNTVFVRTNGDDLTAEVGNPKRPYSTINEAIQNVPANGLVKVATGSYDEYNIATRSGITVEFEEGAIVQPTFSAGVAAIFSDLFGPSAVVDFKITGKGQLISLGFGGSDSCSINAGRNGTIYHIEAELITGINIFGTSTVYFKNTRFRRSLSSYAGAKVVFDNCSFENIFELTRDCNFGYLGEPFLPGQYTFRNCKFLRDSLTNQYGETVEDFMFFINGQNFFISSNQKMEFRGCTFKNTLATANADIFWVFAGNYNIGSRLIIMDCILIGTSARNAIYLTDVGASGTENSELKFFLDNNKTNLLITVVDTAGIATELNNEIPSDGFTFCTTLDID